MQAPLPRILVLSRGRLPCTASTVRYSSPIRAAATGRITVSVSSPGRAGIRYRPPHGSSCSINRQTAWTPTIRSSRQRKRMICAVRDMQALLQTGTETDSSVIMRIRIQTVKRVKVAPRISSRIISTIPSGTVPPTALSTWDFPITVFPLLPAQPSPSRPRVKISGIPRSQPPAVMRAWFST